MSQDTSTQMKTTAFLQGNSREVDESMVREVGPRIVNDILRLLKNAELFGADHNHVTSISSELCELLNATLLERGDEYYALQLTDTNIFINGQLIKFTEEAFYRSVMMRSMFLNYSVNQISFLRGVSPPEFSELFKALKNVKDNKNATLEGFTQPHITLRGAVLRELEALGSDDVRREIIELYAGLVIKSSQYFHQLRHSSSVSARYIKRLIQKCASQFPEYRHVFIGLINLKLIKGQDFVHAVNTAMYSMCIAQELGLERSELVRIGMTAITQDIDRVLQQHGQEVDPIEELGDGSHFKTNMTSVTTMSQMGAKDVLSALRLVTTYERGFPYNKPLPSEWYNEELRPHLLSRIVEIARHYDLLLQGTEDRTSLTADIALQNISEQMGRHYDPRLTKLFINLIGIFPVGEIVMLSSGARALVVQSPSLGESQLNKSVAHRPTVKLIDGSERLINLSLPEHQAMHIVKIVPVEEVDERPGAFFFF